MEYKIEVVEVERTVWVPKEEFKMFVKAKMAKLKVVDGFYRWVLQDEEGLCMIRPKE